jgi:hypothetical protein
MVDGSDQERASDAARLTEIFRTRNGTFTALNSERKPLSEVESIEHRILSERDVQLFIRLSRSSTHVYMGSTKRIPLPGESYFDILFLESPKQRPQEIHILSNGKHSKDSPRNPQLALILVETLAEEEPQAA